MRSLFLGTLSADARDDLVSSLHESQNGNCFICEIPIDRTLHKIEIDHVEPLTVGGKDAPENFAVTHDVCNRSKQASDLRVARIVARFEKLGKAMDRTPNLGDVLKNQGGGKYDLLVRDEGSSLKTTFSQLGSNEVLEFPIYEDKLSGFRYAFMHLPIEYLHHDDRINPRPIGRNLKRLIEEFHKGSPSCMSRSVGSRKALPATFECSTDSTRLQRRFYLDLGSCRCECSLVRIKIGYSPRIRGREQLFVKWHSTSLCSAVWVAHFWPIASDDTSKKKSFPKTMKDFRSRHCVIISRANRKKCGGTF